jgi:hypothetical protein
MLLVPVANDFKNSRGGYCRVLKPGKPKIQKSSISAHVRRPQTKAPGNKQLEHPTQRFSRPLAQYKNNLLFPPPHMLTFLPDATHADRIFTPCPTTPPPSTTTTT